MKEDIKFYIVIAKCGHVGRNKYVEKELTVLAKSRKEAAQKGRDYPRVKHHWKDAIIDVIEVDESEYWRIRVKNYSDPYFRVSNIQEQRLLCPDIDKQIKNREYDDKYKRTERKSRIEYLMKKRKNEERMSIIF